MSSSGRLITDRPNEVTVRLYKALERLIQNRIDDGSFTDQEEVASKAYFSTLEGLDALLIPLVNLPKNIFWEPLKFYHVKLPELIIADINFILSHNSKEDMPTKEQGTPYFTQGKGVRQVPYWTSECASFTLSVLTNFLMLSDKVGLSGLPQQKIMKAIKTNLHWIKLCKRDIGWSWTTDSPSHPWPTWSILDTFEEMLNCELLADIHHLISPEYEPILGKIKESFKTNVVGSYLSDWTEKVVNSKPYDVEAALDLSRLMLAVSLHGNRKDIGQMAAKLFSWAAVTDFENVDYNYHLQAKSDVISDSSLVPSVLRALIIMSGVLKYKGFSELDKVIGQNHKIVLNRVYLHLMKNQLSQGKFQGLWGVRGDGIKYELYYTERTIESLTEFLVHSETAELTPVKTGASEPSLTEESVETETGTAKEAVPDIAGAYLPILDEFSRKIAKTNGDDFFKDVIVIFVLHVLKDLITFVEKFRSLGCSPAEMYFLVKTYDYPDKEKIVAHLRGQGCTVTIPSEVAEAIFLNEAAEILKKCVRRSENEGKKILIIEDGGYFAPLLHSTSFRDKAATCLGAVEQTTKGLRRDKAIEAPQFPILSVASSKLKLFLEAQEVAETLQENIVGTLRKYSDKPLIKQKALVLGFGEIGSKLADSLQKKGISVTVYDTDFSKRLGAEVKNRFRVLEDLKDLSGFSIVIGVSGETSLGEGKDYWTLDHNVILASGSSERVEFNIDVLADISKKITREEIFTKYTLKKDDKIIRLMCDGEPINFALSGGIANSIIDPIYAEMLLAAARVRSGEGLENGVIALPEDLEKEVLDNYRTYHLR